MLDDFLKFEQYLTPVIIRRFYFLQLALISIFGLAGAIFSFSMMTESAFSSLIGLISLVATLIGVPTGFVAARILTEIIMILFQNSEHLADIRARAEVR